MYPFPSPCLRAALLALPPDTCPHTILLPDASQEEVEQLVAQVYSGAMGDEARGLMDAHGLLTKDSFAPVHCEVKIKIKEEDEEEMEEEAEDSEAEEEDWKEELDPQSSESEAADADANDNSEESEEESEDDNWAPKHSKKDVDKKTIKKEPSNPKQPSSSNIYFDLKPESKKKTTANSVSALGKKRGPYKKRKKVDSGRFYEPASSACRYCRAEPRSASGLAKHEKLCLAEVLGSHGCRLCPATLDTKAEVVEHLGEHGVAPEHPCSEDRCPEAFRGEKQRLKHEAAEHGVEGGLAARPLFRYHWSRDSAGQDVEECTCGVEFESRTERITHMRFHHSSLPSYPCQYCAKLNIFTTQEMVAQHEEFWHKHWCDEQGCTHSCESQDKLAHHQFKEHRRPMPDKPKKTEEKPFVMVCCDVCGKQYPNKSKLKEHMEIHSDQQVYCDKCDKVFHRKLNLKLHMKTMHSGQDWICETCSATFTSNRNLKGHIANHHMEKKLQCQHCPKAFCEPKKLRQHMINVHIKNTPYKCKYGCGRAYNDPSNARQHERRQHENDPLIRRGRS